MKKLGCLLSAAALGVTLLAMPATAQATTPSFTISWEQQTLPSHRSAAAAAPATPDTCEEQTRVIARATACSWAYEVGHVIDNKTFEVIGVIEIRKIDYVQLDVKSRTWKHTVETFTVDASGYGAGDWFGLSQVICDSGCATPAPSKPYHYTPGHTDIDTFTLESPGTGITEPVTHVRLHGENHAPDVVSGKTDADFTEYGTLRCDSQPYIQTKGCVFANYKPTFFLSLSDTTTGEVAAHIKRAQASSSHKWGVYDDGVPLRRMYDPAQRDRNREAACPKSRPRPAGKTCDEFPFASTYQGAAMDGANDFSWEWVTSSHNSTAGTALGKLYQDNRLLDDDAFWVTVVN